MNGGAGEEGAAERGGAERVMAGGGKLLAGEQDALLFCSVDFLSL